MNLIDIFKPFTPTDTDTFWIPVIYSTIKDRSDVLYREKYGLYGGVVKQISYDDEDVRLWSKNNLCYRTMQAAEVALNKMFASVNGNTSSFIPGRFETFWFPNPLTCASRKKVGEDCYGVDSVVHHDKFRDFLSRKNMCYKSEEDSDIALRLMIDSLIWK